jgi:creatinine amidohydrolase
MKPTRQSYRLADMTGSEVAQAAAGSPVILLPLGSHEDHGPMLPMGDFSLADDLAGRIAEQANGSGTATYVAPTLPFGAADYFGCAPGALALAPGTFRSALSDLLRGLLRHGLGKIIILNGHGGNAPLIHEVTLGIKRETGLVIPSFYLWKIARQLMLARLGAGEVGRFGHGAEPLLSLSMALRADAVPRGAASGQEGGRLLGLPVTDFGAVAFQDFTIDVPVEFDQVPRTPTAAAGLASAELGRETAEALVAAGARFVVHFDKVASISGVSKSRSTESVFTGSSETNSI